MSDQPELADTDVATGPVQVPRQYRGFLERGFDDVPTPPSGTCVRPGPVTRPPVGSPRTDRESVLALFLVHMFPLGHLPVAADHPERQLPSRARRYPPADHPESALLEDTTVLGYVAQGFRRSPTPPADPSPPAAVLDGYRPPEGPEWESRFVDGAEYVWPSAKEFPEGGTDAAEPVVLPEGTLLDRFGGEHGRIFAPEGTPFARRSLPPAALRAGYRRYRVEKPVPMWRSIAAGWFGQPGGGVRYRAVLSADELLTLGFLADITREAR
ncbi:TNT domain-containing protein [Amycolatopsis panacis]|uniref:TNT domain-containing protein n=1 Tax=Amycolatopsis panacis TaxID=2340917 RepID=UPI001F27C35B|nr:TNT domain-containing protein [Amycolatopsis panacis]